eukprot:TRINITY_DN23778_c0_g1_i2.p1 TRINITY_DN23778_c0_g1~~TRINITY_DN23778_c0_g1_i2.p1  ORF type:complete len:1548 (+),score=411.19 TRINITY_DN23778_c0_g1_i2:83-4645(+)
MGGRNSRQVISPEEARQRLTELEIRKVREFFERHYDRYTDTLSRRSFRDYLLDALHPHLPQQLAEALYNALAQDRSGGLTFDDLLCGICVLQHGTPEERFRLVFYAFDSDRDDQVTQEELQRFATYARMPTTEGQPRLSFGSVPRTGFDLNGFESWASRHQDTELLSWIFQHQGKLFTPGEEKLGAEHATLLPVGSGDKERDNEQLATKLGLEPSEFEELCSAHADLQRRSSLGVVDQDMIEAALPSLPPPIRPMLFRSWDYAGSGTVSNREFLSAAATCRYGRPEEKLALVYRLFAPHQEEGRFSRYSLENLLRAVAYPECLYHRARGEVIPCPEHEPQAKRQRRQELVASAFPSGDNLSGEHFVQWTSSCEAEVVEHCCDFLDTVWALVSTDLRLRPPTVQLECRAVLVLRGQPFSASNPGPPGCDWHLLPAEWWLQWEEHVGRHGQGVLSELPVESPSEQLHRCTYSNLSRGRSECMPTGRAIVPAVDTAPLLDCFLQLRKDVAPGRDFQAVPAMCWRALCAWYGLKGREDQDRIVRRAVQGPGHRRGEAAWELELYPPQVRLCLGDPGSAEQLRSARTVQLSAATTLADLKEECRREFRIDPAAQLRLWSAASGASSSPVTPVGGDSGFELVTADDVTLGSLEIADGHLFTVQVVDPQDGQLASPGGDTASRMDSEADRLRPSGGSEGISPVSVPLQAHMPLDPGQRVESYYYDADRGGRSSRAMRGRVRSVRDSRVVVDFDQISYPVEVDRGWVVRTCAEEGHVCGLQNLGNTCFMNSALQCLSHTRLLREYFLSLQYPGYLYDINMKSRGGMAGKLAVAFAELLQQLWAGDRAVHAPRTFHSTFSQFNPSFRHYRQQDAEEFLASLLAGMSDDVNRVVDRPPYREFIDSDGRPDSDVADERWAAMLAHDDSIITSLFTGQLKSRTECSICGRVSRQFDVLPRLSCELTSYTHRYISVIVHLDGLARLRLTVRVQKDGTILDLLDQAAVALGDGSVHFPGNLRYQGAPSAADLVPTGPSWVSEPRGSTVTVYKTSMPLASISEEAASDRSCALQLHWIPGLTAAGMPEDKPEPPILQVINRRMVQLTDQFTQPWRPRLFGSPVLLPIQGRSPHYADAVDCGETLYAAVWQRVRRFVPDWSPQQGAGAREWPFILTRCNEAGTACSLCSWVRSCFGCKIPHSGPIEPPLRDCDTVAIDWDYDAHRDQYKPAIAARTEDHRSVADCRRQLIQEQRLTLESCIDHYCQEESMDMHCPRCAKQAGEKHKETPQRRQLLFWRFPPVLVIHLKRFGAGQMGVAKLRNMVTFPLQLDLRRWRAPQEAVPEGTLLLDQPGLYQSKDTSGVWWDVTIKELRHDGNYRVHVHDGTTWQDGEKGTIWPSVPRHHIRRRSWLGERRPPATRDLTAYYLYAVINHQGSTEAGHYYAFVRRGRRWWRISDSIVVEVQEDEVVTEEAYLLFYRRLEPEGQHLELAHLVPPMRPGQRPVNPSVVKAARWDPPNQRSKGTLQLLAEQDCVVM